MAAILILADIEGSTGCNRREDAQLFNDGWIRACRELSRDLNALCKELKKAGAGRIRIKDFHRTGFNVFRAVLDPEIELDQGYAAGPTIGIGDVTGFDMLMMIGMHAASGTTGFLPHTLTSKFAGISVNDRLLCEAELFAASVADHGIKPAFFSGCPAACAQAEAAIKGLSVFAIEKPLRAEPALVRQRLAESAAIAFNKACRGELPPPYLPSGPFKTTLTMRDGPMAAEKLRKAWSLAGENNASTFTANSMNELYWQLLKLAYLKPFTLRFLNTSLVVANLAGKIAHIWARKRLTRILSE